MEVGKGVTLPRQTYIKPFRSFSNPLCQSRPVSKLIPGQEW